MSFPRIILPLANFILRGFICLLIALITLTNSINRFQLYFFEPITTTPISPKIGSTFARSSPSPFGTFITFISGHSKIIAYIYIALS